MPHRFRRQQSVHVKGPARSLNVGIVTVAGASEADLAMQRRFLREIAPDVLHVVTAKAQQREAFRGDWIDDPDVRVIETEGADGRDAGMRHLVEQGAHLVIHLTPECVPLPGFVAAYRQAHAMSLGGNAHLYNGPISYLGRQDDLRTMTRERALDLVDPHPRRVFPEPGDVMSNDEHHLFVAKNFAVTPAVWRACGGFVAGSDPTLSAFAQRAAQLGVGMAWVGGAHVFSTPLTEPGVPGLAA